MGMRVCLQACSCTRVGTTASAQLRNKVLSYRQACMVCMAWVCPALISALRERPARKLHALTQWHNPRASSQLRQFITRLDSALEPKSSSQVTVSVHVVNDGLSARPLLCK